LPTKDKISIIFNLLEKFGYEVYNFNARKSHSKGFAGFPDHVIVGKGKLIFVEVKRKGDTLRIEQQKFAKAIKTVLTVNYLVLETENEARQLVNNILENR